MAFSQPPLAGDEDSASFVYTHRVRFHEADPAQRVHNARFVEYLDVAVNELLREVDWGFDTLEGAGCGIATVHLEVDFLRPARVDAELAIVLTVERVGRSSFATTFDVRVASDRVVHGAAVYVAYDLSTDKSCPLPAPLADRLRGMIRAA